MARDAALLAELIATSDSVVALTGAGVSVPSGIPDFRSAGSGLWENVNPMEVAHIGAFHRDPKRFWSFYGERFVLLSDKKPNPAHAALAELERRGLLQGVITQNIDGLHQLAGSREVVEVHGSVATASCPRDGSSHSRADVISRIASAEDGIPRCTCGEPLKPDVVLFGEMLPEHALARAERMAVEADLLICVGSSLEVHPVAAIPQTALAAGARLAIITQGRTPYDHLAAVRLGGDVAEELLSVVSCLSDPA